MRISAYNQAPQRKNLHFTKSVYEMFPRQLPLVSFDIASYNVLYFYVIRDLYLLFQATTHYIKTIKTTPKSMDQGNTSRIPLKI